MHMKPQGNVPRHSRGSVQRTSSHGQTADGSTQIPEQYPLKKVETTSLDVLPANIFGWHQYIAHDLALLRQHRHNCHTHCMLQQDMGRPNTRRSAILQTVSSSKRGMEGQAHLPGGRLTLLGKLPDRWSAGGRVPATPLFRHAHWHKDASTAFLAPSTGTGQYETEPEMRPHRVQGQCPQHPHLQAPANATHSPTSR